MYRGAYFCKSGPVSRPYSCFSIGRFFCRFESFLVVLQDAMIFVFLEICMPEHLLPRQYALLLLMHRIPWKYYLSSHFQHILLGKSVWLSSRRY